MIASIVQRIPQNTSASNNEQIRHDTEQNIAYCVSRGVAAINRRLAELDDEWHIERTLEASASIVSLVGLTIGTTADHRCYALPIAVSAFLLQHKLHGWCPPMPVFRRMGIRTASEIDYERYALKTVRGDFREVLGHDRGTSVGAHTAIEADRSWNITQFVTNNRISTSSKCLFI